MLTEFKRVLKEDEGLDLNISKTAVLSKVITLSHSLMCHTSSLITHLNLFTLVGNFPLTLSSLMALWELVCLLIQINLFDNLYLKMQGHYRGR